MVHGALGATKPFFATGAPPNEARSIEVSLPYLSATYKYFSFDENASLVTFYNGVTFELTPEEGLLFGQEYRTKPALPEKIKHAHVEALIKIEGQEWLAEDWTNRSQVTYCRDVKAERIERLVLIISK